MTDREKLTARETLTILAGAAGTTENRTLTVPAWGRRFVFDRDDEIQQVQDIVYDGRGRRFVTTGRPDVDEEAEV